MLVGSTTSVVERKGGREGRTDCNSFKADVAVKGKYFKG